MDSNFRFLDLIEHFFYTAPERVAAKGREPQPRFDDRQRQVYRAPGQAGPGNDIHAGSPSLEKAPTRGPASLARFSWAQARSATDQTRIRRRLRLHAYFVARPGSWLQHLLAPSKQRMVMRFEKLTAARDRKFESISLPAASLASSRFAGVYGAAGNGRAQNHLPGLRTHAVPRRYQPWRRDRRGRGHLRSPPARRAFTSIVRDLTFFLVMVCILAKGLRNQPHTMTISLTGFY
jgi:hypothetical protein